MGGEWKRLVMVGSEKYMDIVEPESELEWALY